MRVLRRDDDHGIATVYVALSLLVIFGAGAIAVDGGMMWAERRDLVADVDAAALAAADTHSRLECTGTGAWVALPTSHVAHVAAVSLLEKNQGEPVSATDVTVERACADDNWGKLRVTYVGTVSPLFSAIYGFEELSVENLAVAAFEPIENGLRPLSICVDDGQAADSVIEQWLASPPDTKLTTSFAKTWQPTTEGIASNCGDGGSGSWGWLCFDKSVAACSADNLADIMLDGWPYDVDVGEPPPSTPPPVNGLPINSLPYNGWTDYDCIINSSPLSTFNDPCDTTTGNVSSSKLQDALDAINCDLDDAGELLATPPDNDSCDDLFPVLGVWEIVGSGSNAVLKPSAFIAITVRHPSYITNPKMTDPGGKDVCQDVTNHPTSSTWFNDPDPWDGNTRCLTLQLSGVYDFGGLEEHGFVGWETRLCGVAGDPEGDRCF